MLNYTVTYVESGKEYAVKVPERRMKSYARTLENMPSVTAITVSHDHVNVLEIGSVGHYGNSEDCGYGCKIVKCEECGAVFESHKGCKKGQ